MSDEQKALDYSVDTFCEDSKKLGCELDARQKAQFERYSELLVLGNEKMNLTRIVSPVEVLIKHFLDSLFVGEWINQLSRVNRYGLLDMGSGAGLPGLALKIAFPDLQVVLCDSQKKRVVFLQEVIDQLHLSGIEAIHSRAEELALRPQFREGFSLVTARAVARLNVLVEWCLPFVEVGGIFLAFKGPDVEEEVRSSHMALDFLGGTVSETRMYDLPLNMGGRSLVVVEKTAHSPKGFPRGAGEAVRKPLG